MKHLLTGILLAGLTFSSAHGVLHKPLFYKAFHTANHLRTRLKKAPLKRSLQHTSPDKEDIANAAGGFMLGTGGMVAGLLLGCVTHLFPHPHSDKIPGPLAMGTMGGMAGSAIGGGATGFITFCMIAGSVYACTK